MTADQLTEEQEILLANVIVQARERAKRTWKTTNAFSPAAPDDAFDRGFMEAIDFLVSDEFESFISRLKAMLNDGGLLSTLGR